MFEILKAMIKEEWRVHSSFFGGRYFAIFPLIVAVFTFVFSFFLPIFGSILTSSDIYLLIHYCFLIFGVSIGGFALFGREMMNRRFGQASMVAYSSRTLPVSEKRIFLNLAMNDIIFYFLLYILPMFLAFTAASWFTGFFLPNPAVLLVSVMLSFLVGISVIFLLSTIYVRTGRIFAILLLAAGIVSILAGSWFSINLAASFPPLVFFTSGSLDSLLYSLLLIAVPLPLSLAFLKVDFPEKIRRVGNGLDPLSRKLSFFDQPHLVSKDLLDLHRSEGGVGKIIFSFLLPIILIWAMLYIFSGLFGISQSTVFLIFSFLVGILSTSIYNWLTQYDIFSSYAFLPVKVSDIMKSKLRGFLLLNVASVAVILAAGVIINQLTTIPLALFSFALISAYSTAITLYVGGLNPDILIYNGKIFLQYIGAIAPFIVISILISIISPAYLLLLILLAPISFFVLRRSYEKWNLKEQLSF